MNSTILIQCSGVLLILLAIAHLFFPKPFHWKEELSRLSLLNRQIFLVHCFFIALVLMIFGCLCLFYTEQLLQNTPLSHAVLAGMAMFWFARLIIQLFVYDSKLWRGNRFRTVVHYLFTAFWISLVLVYTLPLL